MKERNCKTCTHNKERIEMISPNFSAKISYCNRGQILDEPKPCVFENTSKWKELKENVRKITS